MLDEICTVAQVNVKDFVNFDLNLVDAHKPAFTGIHNEFISSARLDNQITCYSLMRALYETAAIEHKDSVILGLMFDNEEIGSETTQGANSIMQKTTIDRILTCTKLEDQELYQKVIRRSLNISSDCGHAVHPN